MTTEEMPAPIGTVTAFPLSEWSAIAAAEAMVRSFEDHLIPVTMDGPTFDQRFRAEHVDGYLSEIYLSEGELAGLVLVGQRGWTARVAALGCTPTFRGRGLAHTIMERVIQRTHLTGARRLVLEVFEADERAIRLYDRLGFRPTQRIVGYRWTQPDPAGPGRPGDHAPPRDRSGTVLLRPRPPQPRPHPVAAHTRNTRRRHSSASRVRTGRRGLRPDPAVEDHTVLHGIVVRPEARREGHGRRLLAALRDRDPGQTWMIPPLIPEKAGAEFFAATGWAAEELSQVEMEYRHP